MGRRPHASGHIMPVLCVPCTAHLGLLTASYRRNPAGCPSPSPHPTQSNPAAAEGAVEAVARLVRECMEGVAGEVSLRVPLRVRLSRGPSWGELQELQLAD